jgi:hypothetical protein
MSKFAEGQLKLRDAVVRDRVDPAVPLLAGGDDPLERLMIHHRHYETSLVGALLEKFPATVWLAGSTLVTAAARRFVREQPPESPCIAEYGEGFPEFLSKWTTPERKRYFRQFAELEWHVGQVAVGIEKKAITGYSLAGLDGEVLADVRLKLQPGARYMHASWPIDRLLSAYLHETADDNFFLEPIELWLEVRGARGEFNIGRLDAGTYAFRNALAHDESLGTAAALALEADGRTDPGQSLVDLFAEGLAVSAARRIHYPIDL